MRYLITLILLLGFSKSVGAQVIINTLHEAFELASQQNLTLKEAALKTAIAGKQQEISRSSLLPGITALGSWQQNFSLPVNVITLNNNGEQQRIETRFGTSYTMSGAIDITLPLINTSAWKQQQISNYQEELSGLQQAAQAQQLKQEIARVYYTCLLHTTQQQMLRKNDRKNDTLLANAQRKKENGIIDPLEFNRIRTLKLSSANQLQQVSLARETALSRLKILLGIAPTATLRLTQDLTQTATITQPYEVSGSRLPAYQASVVETRISESRVNEKELSRLPVLNAFARFSRQALGDDFNFYTDRNGWFANSYAGLQMSLPLFNGLGTHASVQQARQNAQLARIRQQRTLLEANQQIREIQLNRKKALRGTDNTRNIFTISEENYRIASYKYEQGLFSADQLISLYSEQVEARNAYLEQLSSLLSAEAALFILAN